MHRKNGRPYSGRPFCIPVSFFCSADRPLQDRDPVVVVAVVAVFRNEDAEIDRERLAIGFLAVDRHLETDLAVAGIERGFARAVARGELVIGRRFLAVADEQLDVLLLGGIGERWCRRRIASLMDFDSRWGIFLVARDERRGWTASAGSGIRRGSRGGSGCRCGGRRGSGRRGGRCRSGRGGCLRCARHRGGHGRRGSRR